MGHADHETSRRCPMKNSFVNECNSKFMCTVCPYVCKLEVYTTLYCIHTILYLEYSTRRNRVERRET